MSLVMPLADALKGIKVKLYEMKNGKLKIEDAEKVLEEMTRKYVDLEKRKEKENLKKKFNIDEGYE